MSFELIPRVQDPRRIRHPSTRMPKFTVQHLEDSQATSSSIPTAEESTITLGAWNELFRTTPNDEKDVGHQAGKMKANTETEIGGETGNMIVPSTTATKPASPATSTTPALSTLHKLPLELRQLCYEYAMDTNYLSSVGAIPEKRSSSARRAKWTISLPPICRTSKAIFQESAPIYIASVTFLIHQPSMTPILTRFLEYLPDDLGFKSVRSLRFEKVDRGRKGEFSLELAVRCQGLRKLRLVFPVTEALAEIEASVWDTMNVEAVRDMLAGCKLDKVLNCGSLEELYIVGENAGGLEWAGSSSVADRIVDGDTWRCAPS